MKLEGDLLEWADGHLPQASAATRRQSGEDRRRYLARILVRRFYIEPDGTRGGRWWMTFCDWIDQMPRDWFADFLRLAPHLPGPPATMIEGGTIEDNWLAWIEHEQRYAGKWQETEGDNPPGDAPPEPAAAAAEPVPVAAKAAGLFGH